MHKSTVVLLALVAVMAATMLLPSHTVYACTAEYPEEYFETHTIDVPPLPDGISVYTTLDAIEDAVYGPSFSKFTYEQHYNIQKNREYTSLSFMAVGNLGDKPLYVLAERDKQWVTPPAQLAVTVPDGLVAVFLVEPGQGLSFGNELLVNFQTPHYPITINPPKDFVNNAYIKLFYDEKVIDIVLTTAYRYNVNYLADKAALDRGMDECQRLMAGDPTVLLFRYPLDFVKQYGLIALAFVSGLAMVYMLVVYMAARTAQFKGRGSKEDK